MSISRRHLSATLALAAIVLFTASTVAAQAPPPFDHLKCYKISDSIKKTYKVDLVPQQAPPFSVETGCKLVVPAKLFCIDVRKTHVQPPPPLTANGATTHDFLCYKIACPQKIDFTQSVRDQFGQRPVKVKPPKMLCAPAIKIISTPTPPAATRTATPQPTQTPICQLDSASGQCGGPCPIAGDQCVFTVAADGTAKCDCQPPPQCGPAGAHTCKGPCPNPADQCRVSPTDTCICVHPCGFNAHSGQCGGECPANEICQGTTPPSTACNCVPQPHPCGLSNNQCSGDCQLSDESCLFDPAVGCRCVSNGALCANGNPASCGGQLCPGVPGTPNSHCQSNAVGCQCQ